MPSDEYQIPATLVHRALWSIIGGICLIGGYMGINFGLCQNFKLRTNLTISTDGVEQDNGGFGVAWNV